MKIALFAMSVCICFVAASANAKPEGRAAWRVAQSANACLINCANENEACKRLCSATYNVPCVSACDNQAQFCRQNCQR